jgi:hypothetical protein
MRGRERPARWQVLRVDTHSEKSAGDSLGRVEQVVQGRAWVRWAPVTRSAPGCRERSRRPRCCQAGQIEVDVAVLGPGGPGEPRRVLSLGEAKWGEVMDTRQVDRLRRARDLLAVRGYQAEGTVLACYSGRGFSDGLRALAGRDPRILLVGLDRLYGREGAPPAGP